MKCTRISWIFGHVVTGRQENVMGGLSVLLTSHSVNRPGEDEVINEIWETGWKRLTAMAVEDESRAHSRIARLQAAGESTWKPRGRVLIIKVRVSADTSSALHHAN